MHHAIQGKQYPTVTHLCCRLSDVFLDDEFEGAMLLKLSPYSPMMNPIENLWSSMKSHVKTLLRERLAAFMGPPPDNQSRLEFRMSYLEHIANEVIAGECASSILSYS